MDKLGRYCSGSLRAEIETAGEIDIRYSKKLFKAEVDSLEDRGQVYMPEDSTI
ncbi:MAG: hypothetical protein ABII27_08845 [bacterium]